MADAAARLWDGLVAAARGEPSSPAARAALTLSADDGQPRLGWVTPVPWTGLEQRLAQTRCAPHGHGGLLIAATGGWAFAARAVADSAGSPGRLTVADTLDAPALARVFAAACRHDAAAITVSASGQTYETRLLTQVISLAWGSRPGIPRPISEATVPGGLSLTPKTAVNALLGAPLSIPFALAGVATGRQRFHGAYASFTQVACEVGRRAAALACAVPLAAALRLEVVLPAWAGEGVWLWALQALRQGLGGRPHRPIWSEVSVDDDRTRPVAGPAAPRRVYLAEALPAGMPAPARGTAESLAAAMTVMYAAAVLTACLGIRSGIAFTSHPAVRDYKMLLNEHPECAETTVEREGVTRAATQWLSRRTELAGAHLVWYGSDPPAVTAARLAELTGQRWEVHAGSRWNHHSYQAVHGGGPGRRGGSGAPGRPGRPDRRSSCSMPPCTR